MNWQNKILLTLAFLSAILIPIFALATFFHAKYRVGFYDILYKTAFYSEVDGWVDLIKTWGNYDG